MKIYQSMGFVLSFFLGSISMADVTTVENVDLNKYIGMWYEVASIPQSFQKKCVANTTAVYSYAENGLIKVDNTCETASGEREGSEGRAKVEDQVINSKLKVTFVKILDWVFLFGGNYWIIDLADDYSYALIGDPTAKYAWLLSRTPSVTDDLFLLVEKKFKSQGYNTCEILTSIQTSGMDRRIPLCNLAQ